MHGERVEWSDSEYLMAAAVDALHTANWLTVRMNLKKNARPPDPPDPTPRPGVSSDRVRPGEKRFKGRAMSKADLDALIAVVVEPSTESSDLPPVE